MNCYIFLLTSEVASKWQRRTIVWKRMHRNAGTDKHCLSTGLFIISGPSRKALRVFTKKGFASLSSLPLSQLNHPNSSLSEAMWKDVDRAASKENWSYVLEYTTTTAFMILCWNVTGQFVCQHCSESTDSSKLEPCLAYQPAFVVPGTWWTWKE